MLVKLTPGWSVWSQSERQLWVTGGRALRVDETFQMSGEQDRGTEKDTPHDSDGKGKIRSLLNNMGSS